MNDTLENGTVYSLPNTSAALTAVHSVNLVLGLPVNGYAMWLILSRAGGGGGTTMASEFFFLNLIVSVATSPLATVFYLIALLCDVKAMAWARVWAVVLFYASVPSFQCCVCAERYAAVVHPVAFLRYKALRYRVVACCCVVWPVLLASSVGITACASYASLASASLATLGCSVLLGFYLACVSVVAFCCLSVLRALKQPGPGEGQQRDSTGMKRQAFRVILTSLVVMALTVMICSTNFLILLFKIGITPTTYNYATYALASMTGFVHPLLYIRKAGKLPCFEER